MADIAYGLKRKGAQEVKLVMQRRDSCKNDNIQNLAATVSLSWKLQKQKPGKINRRL